MVPFSDMASRVVLFAALMLPGFLMGKAKRLREENIVVPGKLIADVSMPALVFVSLAEADVGSIDPVLLLLSMLVPAAVIFVLCGIGQAVFRRRKSGGDIRAARFCSAFSNCGFLGIPLSAAVFPDMPEVTLFVSLANVVTSLILLTFGIRLLSGEELQGKASVFSALLRPVTFAALLGGIASVFHLGSVLPSVISYSGMLAQLTAPLSMIVLGYELSVMKPHVLFGNGSVYIVAALKLLAAPFLACTALLVVKTVFRYEVPYALFAAMFLATAVSTASSAPTMAREQGITDGFAAAATVANTLLCVITLPLLWLLLNCFI